VGLRTKNATSRSIDPLRDSDAALDGNAAEQQCLEYAKRVQRFRIEFSQPFKLGPWAVVTLVWAGIALTMAAQNHLYETALRQRFTWLDSFRYPAIECLFWCLVTPVLLWLVQRFDLLSPNRRKRVALFFSANGALELVHALYRLPLHHFVYPRMEPIPRSALFRYYVLGNMLNDVWVFWSIVAIAHLALYYARASDRERALARAQMQALKSQLQPHFFFNALNSISSLMRDDVEVADDMITRLSDLLRVSLKTDAAQEIPLLKEVEVIETYIEIERLRFSDRLNFSCDLTEETATAKLPALILLPLVENAVRHGIAPRSRPGEINITARRRNGSLSLTISNDAPSAQHRPVEGIGLSGTRTRLQQHYGAGSSFDYELSPEGVMTVRITLPFVAEKTAAAYGDSRSHR
jgi:two-component system, LytTR family, sensor kinase